MKAIVLMFDSLNKNMLSAYGCEDTITPNFERLRQKTQRFDNFYAGSLPCMPARREMHTGRYNFLHRGWSPIEPFDDSMPELLKKNGIHSHLITDHKHYWRDGGATYHSRFNTYEFVRGQEGDNWKGIVNKPVVNYQSGEPDEIKQRKIGSRTQHLINKQFMKNDQDHQLIRTIDLGLAFLEQNATSDPWFLQLECFDPHEPFFVPDKYLEKYGVNNKDFDGWPPYYFCTEDENQKKTIQNYYKALLTMVDDQVGRVLDIMDKYDLWKDTLLIVNTDHGFLLGEHEWWGKNIMPLYNEIANIPFFIWHPVYQQAGQCRQALAQTIDIPATLLDYFNIPQPKDMQGQSLTPVLKNGAKVRDYALFGCHGSHINITDGHFVYMRAPVQRGIENLFEYTLMPTKINRRFTPEELKHATLVNEFEFTKGCPVLKIPTESIMAKNSDRFGHRFYDVINDPKQQFAYVDLVKELELLKAMSQLMLHNEAPQELFIRYGLNQPLSLEQLTIEHQATNAAITEFDTFELNNELRHGLLVLLDYATQHNDEILKKQVIELAQNRPNKAAVFNFVNESIPESQQPVLFYRIALEMRIN